MTPQMRDPGYWIDTLSLRRHPEGGWYRETYRSTEALPAAALPDRYDSPRNFGTSIYFLLAGDEVSALHRLRSDELWYFHLGAPLTVHLFPPTGGYRAVRLGPNPDQGEHLQLFVPHGTWFGAAVEPPGPFALVGCSVIPGFDFGDFELAERTSLSAHFPEQWAIIQRLTSP